MQIIEGMWWPSSCNYPHDCSGEIRKVPEKVTFTDRTIICCLGGFEDSFGYQFFGVKYLWLSRIRVCERLGTFRRENRRHMREKKPKRCQLPNRLLLSYCFYHGPNDEMFRISCLKKVFSVQFPKFEAISKGQASYELFRDHTDTGSKKDAQYIS
jgi:hypothetical protein